MVENGFGFQTVYIDHFALNLVLCRSCRSWNETIFQLFLSLFVFFFGHILRKRHNYYEFVRYLGFSDDEDEENEYATFEKVSHVYASIQQQYPVFVCLIDAGISMDIAQIIMQYVPAIAECKKSKTAHRSTWLDQFY